MKRLTRGDFVRLRLHPKDDWTEGFVALASDTNPSSVLVMFRGALRAGGGLLMGGVPLFVDYTRGTVSSLLDEEYEMEVQS